MLKWTFRRYYIEGPWIRLHSSSEIRFTLSVFICFHPCGRYVRLYGVKATPLLVKLSRFLGINGSVDTFPPPKIGEQSL